MGDGAAVGTGTSVGEEGAGAGAMGAAMTGTSGRTRAGLATSAGGGTGTGISVSSCPKLKPEARDVGDCIGTAMPISVGTVRLSEGTSSLGTALGGRIEATGTPSGDCTGDVGDGTWVGTAISVGDRTVVSLARGGRMAAGTSSSSWAIDVGDGALCTEITGGEEGAPRECVGTPRRWLSGGGGMLTRASSWIGEDGAGEVW